MLVCNIMDLFLLLCLELGRLATRPPVTVLGLVVCILDAAARRSRANRASCKHGPSSVALGAKTLSRPLEGHHRDPPQILDAAGAKLSAIEERWESTANAPLDLADGFHVPPMKLRYAAVFAAAPLAQGFVPARAAMPRARVIVRSEPIEINAPTVYSHWSANVNEEVFLPRLEIVLTQTSTPPAARTTTYNAQVQTIRAQEMYTALKTHKYEREARAAALEDHKSFFAGLLGRADANARAVNPATDPSLAKAAVAARRS